MECVGVSRACIAFFGLEIREKALYCAGFGAFSVELKKLLRFNSESGLAALILLASLPAEGSNSREKEPTWTLTFTGQTAKSRIAIQASSIQSTSMSSPWCRLLRERYHTIYMKKARIHSSLLYMMSFECLFKLLEGL